MQTTVDQLTQRIINLENKWNKKSFVFKFRLFIKSVI
jgi:hypothetical protein